VVAIALLATPGGARADLPCQSTLPVSERCLLELAYGKPGVTAVDDALRTDGDLRAAAARAGLDKATTQRLILFCDHAKLITRAWDPPVQETEALAGARAAVGRAHAALADQQPKREIAALVGAVAVLDRIVGAKRVETARARLLLSAFRHALSDKAAAQKALEAARVVLVAVLDPEHPNVVGLHVDAAMMLIQEGNFADAIAPIETGCGRFDDVLGPAHPDAAECRYKLGLALARSDASRARREIARGIAGLSKAMGADHLRTADARFARGLIEWIAGDLDAALVHLRAVRRLLSSRLGADHDNTRHVTKRIARVLRLQGDRYYKSATPTRAVAAHQESIRLYEAVGHRDTAELRGGLLALGEVQQTLADLVGARRSYERALKLTITARGADHSETASATTSLAMIHWWLGDLKRARGLLERAVVIYDKADPKSLAASRALNTLGTVLYHQGAISEARARFELSLKLAEGQLGKGHPELVTRIIHLGLIRWAQKDLAGARRQMERGVAIAKAHGGEDHVGTAMPLSNLANVLAAQGELDEAMRLFQKVKTLFARAYGERHMVVAGIHGLIAFLHVRRADLPAGIEAMRTASELGREHFLRNIDVAQRDSELRGLLDQLRHYMDMSLSLETDPLRSLAIVLAWQGAGTAAEQLWRDLRHAERSSDAAGRDRVRRYRDVQRKLGAGGSQMSADARRSAISVRDKLAANLAQTNPAFGQRRRIANATPRAVCARLARRKSSLVAIVPYRRIDPMKPDDPSTVNKDERYAPPAYDAIVAWGAPCTATRMALGSAADIDAQVGAFHEAVEVVAQCAAKQGSPHLCGKALAALDRAGRTVRKQVWDPIEAVLPAKTARVRLVAGGALAGIPFGALAHDDGVYVMERRDISYLPYPAAVMRAASRTEIGPAAAFVAGDVNYASAMPDPSRVAARWQRCGPTGCTALDAGAQKGTAALLRGSETGAGSPVCGFDATWGALPGTEAPAVGDKLGRTLKGGAILATGDSVTEPALRAVLPGQRVIHLATHGFFATEAACGPKTDPLRRSALVLSGANPGVRSDDPRRDGILTAREVVSLDLRGTDLVVLSACETGRGEQLVGDGPASLGRAFLLAGADTAIVSLWKVPTDATRTLFERFYTIGADKHDALQRARLATLRDLRAQGLSNPAFLIGAFIRIAPGP